jgi:hypothetical protein
LVVDSKVKIYKAERTALAEVGDNIIGEIGSSVIITLV